MSPTRAFLAMSFAVAVAAAGFVLPADAAALVLVQNRVKPTAPSSRYSVADDAPESGTMATQSSTTTTQQTSKPMGDGEIKELPSITEDTQTMLTDDAYQHEVAMHDDEKMSEFVRQLLELSFWKKPDEEAAKKAAEKAAEENATISAAKKEEVPEDLAISVLFPKMIKMTQTQK